MSFFNKIKNAIFGKAEAAPQTSAPAGTPPTTASPTAAIKSDAATPDLLALMAVLLIITKSHTPYSQHETPRAHASPTTP